VINIATKVNWKFLSPNEKSDIPEIDSSISDPLMVLRCTIETEDDDDFEVVSPAVTGRLERAIVYPSHNDQPANNFDIYLYQNYVQSPESDGGEYTDSLDVLNGKGVDLPNNAITHLQSKGILDDPSRENILNQLFVKDTLRLSINNIDTGFVRMFIYLCFSGGL